MPLEAQTEAATVLGNGVSPKSGRRGFGPKSITSLLARLGLRFDDPAVEDHQCRLRHLGSDQPDRRALVDTVPVHGRLPRIRDFFCRQLSPKHEEVVAGILGALLRRCHGLHVSLDRAL